MSQIIPGTFPLRILRRFLSRPINSLINDDSSFFHRTFFKEDVTTRNFYGNHFSKKPIPTEITWKHWLFNFQLLLISEKQISFLWKLGDTFSKVQATPKKISKAYFPSLCEWSDREKIEGKNYAIISLMRMIATRIIIILEKGEKRTSQNLRWWA